MLPNVPWILPLPHKRVINQLFTIIEENKKTAFLWYRFAYEMEEKSATLPLASCYETGAGVERSYSTAIKLYKIAEADGYPEARERVKALLAKKLSKIKRRLYSTAMRLIHQRKLEAAINHLEVAAEISSPEAIYTLGCFYEFGIKVKPNKDYAFSLYEAAYALGFRDPRATYKLKVLKRIR